MLFYTVCLPFWIEIFTTEQSMFQRGYNVCVCAWVCVCVCVFLSECACVGLRVWEGFLGMCLFGCVLVCMYVCECVCVGVCLGMCFLCVDV